MKIPAEYINENYSNERFTCPCCGYVTLVNSSGGHDICPVCYWEDDLYQLNNPEATDGSNENSLKEAQRNFIDIGASHWQWKTWVRNPLKDEPKDPAWQQCF
jgi:hypothetical protein